MTDTQKANLKLAIQNLRANPKKAKEEMCDKSGGRCCLCVMSDTAEDILGVERGSLRYDDFYPKNDIEEVFGIKSENKSYYSPEFANSLNFIMLNDGFTSLYCHVGIKGIHQNDFKEYSHVEIADLIEKKFLTE